MRSLQWYKRGAAYFPGEEWVKSGEELAQLFTRANHSDSNTYTLSVKSEECF